MKTFLTVAFFCLCALPLLAQNAGPVTQIAPGSTAGTSPAKSIGPAPAHTPQSHILYDVALSSQTRQTLQEAMNSARTSDSAPSATPTK